MSQALSRKWRPARFDEVVGQEHITRTLQNSIAAGRIGHAYLFCGPRGTGKTTTARLLAKAANCLDENLAGRPCNKCTICQAVNEGRFLDLIEIDAASNTGVDDIRDLRDKINFSPNQGRFKVYIIDEVHMLSTAAFNALLKTLEEPPAHAMFILATTEEHKVPATIKSRCQQFNFRLFTMAEIGTRLSALAAKESLTIEPGAMELIARQGAGSIRDAESLLDQLVVAPGDTITLERASMVLGTASNTAVIALTDAILNADGAGGLRLIHEALASGADARQFSRQMVAHLRTVLLLQAAGPEMIIDVPDAQLEALQRQAGRAPRQTLIDAIRRFQDTAQKPAISWQPQLPLELAFMEMLPEQPLPVFAAPVRKPAAVVPEPAAAVPQAAVIAPVDVPAPEPETTPSASTTEAPAVTKPVAVEEEIAPSTLAAAEEKTAVTLTLEQLRSQWRGIVSLAGRQSKNLPALLAMCKPLGVEGQMIVLGFDYPIFKEKFDKTEDAAATISDALAQLLGGTYGIRSVVTGDYTLPIEKADFEALAQELGAVVRQDDLS
jgi:DNA polymerase-3 subunit gamma/tau